MSRITLTPAYGRDYKSAKAATKAYLEDGHDFVFHCFGHADDGRYVNAEQLEGEREVTIRYARLTKVVDIYSGRRA